MITVLLVLGALGLGVVIGIAAFAPETQGSRTVARTFRLLGALGILAIVMSGRPGLLVPYVGGVAAAAIYLSIRRNAVVN
jgi:hypothetical protein